MIKPGLPFSNGSEYEDFKYQFCERCQNYREREGGFPEMPDKGGCLILDAMERYRYRTKGFPSEWVVELYSADDGSPIAWHACRQFHSSEKDTEKQWKLMEAYFTLFKKALVKSGGEE